MHWPYLTIQNKVSEVNIKQYNKETAIKLDGKSWGRGHVFGSPWMSSDWRGRLTWGIDSSTDSYLFTWVFMFLKKLASCMLWVKGHCLCFFLIACPLGSPDFNGTASRAFTRPAWPLFKLPGHAWCPHPCEVTKPVIKWGPMLNAQHASL